ncbi:MAG: radical SAM protein, partial [Vicinamibacterales bacterium]
MTQLRRREFHEFEAAGQQFLYLVPSAAVFALDDCSRAVLDELASSPGDVRTVVDRLSARYDEREVTDAIVELQRVRAIGESATPKPMPKIVPLKPVPLQTLVVNVTNQCNLACTYCYEYGEDKIVDTENGRQPKFMSEETARESVEFMLRESRESPTAHLTFFGGETLMNFPVLKSTIAYARRRAAEMGKEVDFSLTTNATLLRPDVIEFLADNRVGVTISIDGPEEVQDKFRVFKNGRGSYQV